MAVDSTPAEVVMPTYPQGYVPVATLEVTTVRPRTQGFQLQGRGADGADYVFEMDLDMPIDQQTRTVLGEILSQSQWRVLRRAHRPLEAKSRRKSARSESKPS